MTAREIDKAKSFAAVVAGVAVIGAAAAASAGYTLPAMIAGGFLIVAGVVLAMSTKAN